MQTTKQSTLSVSLRPSDSSFAPSFPLTRAADAPSPKTLCCKSLRNFDSKKNSCSRYSSPQSPINPAPSRVASNHPWIWEHFPAFSSVLKGVATCCLCGFPQGILHSQRGCDLLLVRISSRHSAAFLSVSILCGSFIGFLVVFCVVKFLTVEGLMPVLFCLGSISFWSFVKTCFSQFWFHVYREIKIVVVQLKGRAALWKKNGPLFFWGMNSCGIWCSKAHKAH